MSVPQVIVIVMLALRLLIHGLLDGQPVKDPTLEYSFARACVSVALSAGVLWWGGFFGGAQ